MLAACAPTPQAQAADVAALELLDRYMAESYEAASWAETPVEAWDVTAEVLDEWAPALWALLAVQTGDERALYCAARELWRQRGVVVPDMDCVMQRPCWLRGGE
jgi:hypothetical protein